MSSGATVGPNAGLSSTPQPVLLQTVVGGYVFDAVLQAQHDATLTITTNPVETGAALTDNSYVNPSKLTLQIGMSDVLKDRIPGQFSGGPSRSVTAYQALKQLQMSRIPVAVTTRLGTYPSMLVAEISVTDDNTTAYGLKATVTLQEILVATVQVVKISSRPQVTGSTNSGTVQPVAPNQSILSQILQALTGSPQLAGQ